MSRDSDRVRDWRKAYGLSQAELAEKLGVSRGAVSNWEMGLSGIDRDNLAKLKALGFDSSAGPFANVVARAEKPIPYIGLLSASAPVNWRELDQADTTEMVPGSWDTRDVFSGRIESESMMPMLSPGDLAIFRRESLPRIGKIVLFVSAEGTAAVKQLIYREGEIVLHSLSPRYQDARIEGQIVGLLIGMIRADGQRVRTEYDPAGLTP